MAQLAGAKANGAFGYAVSAHIRSFDSLAGPIWIDPMCFAGRRSMFSSATAPWHTAAWSCRLPQPTRTLAVQAIPSSRSMRLANPR
jgi:hypothetical protein